MRKALQASLHHMISIQVFDELHNTDRKRRCDKLYFLRWRQHLDHLLHGSCTMCIQTHLNKTIAETDFTQHTNTL